MSNKIVEFLETFRNAAEQLAMQGGMSDKEVAIWAREFKDAQWTTIVEGDDSTLPEVDCKDGEGANVEYIVDTVESGFLVVVRQTSDFGGAPQYGIQSRHHTPAPAG